jgi:hypothetical protein
MEISNPSLKSNQQSLPGVVQPEEKWALAEAGYPRDRAISFTPTGLVAYVEDPDAAARRACPSGAGRP